VLSLNLLRGSRLNPKLSAWAQLNGTFDFNRTPLAPPGIRVLVHQKPDNRSTWSPHAEDGWYVGPALESYRCYRIWLFATRAERVSDTISWFPTKVNMPLASTNDLILAALTDIVHALQHPTPAASLVPLTDNHVTALHQLTTLFTGLTAPTPTVTSSPAAPVLRVGPPTPQALRPTLPPAPLPPHPSPQDPYWYRPQYLSLRHL
jgi:hypothetical protein